jgi:hypothetical protein
MVTPEVVGHIDPVCLVELKDERGARKSAEDLAVELLRSVQIADAEGNATDVKIRRASSLSIYPSSSNRQDVIHHYLDEPRRGNVTDERARHAAATAQALCHCGDLAGRSCGRKDAMMDESDWLAERFEEHRSHLRAVAYRMLGSLNEADDAVQEAWLRLSRADTSSVENLGGWLTRVVARVCLDMLR